MKLLLVDGNSLLNRAYYATKNQRLTAVDGTPTAALLTFINIIERFSKELKPDIFAVAFDLPEPTFRHQRFKEYKAQRSGMAEDLAVQLPWAKRILAAMNISILTSSGYEADDVIGSYATAAKDAGYEVAILTGDRDSFQLIQDQISVVYPSTNKQGSTVTYFDSAKFYEKYGINPSQLIDLKALMGDSSDNIPGVKGVGEKTATKLLQEYGDLEGIYEHLSEIKGSTQQKLADDREMAFLSRELATIVTDMPLPISLQDLGRKEIDRAELLDIFQKLKFISLIDRFGLRSAEQLSLEQMPAVKLPAAVDSWQRFCELNPKEVVLMYDEKHVVFYCKAGYWLTDIVSDTQLEVLAKTKCQVLTFGYKDLLVRYNLSPYILKTQDLSILAYLLNSSECRDFERAYFAALNKEISIAKDELYLVNLANLASELYDEQYRQLSERDQLSLLNDIELPLIPILAEMEQIGIKIDRKKAEEVNQELLQREETLRQEIYSYAKSDFNLNSPKQLAEFLFDDLGLKPLKKTSGGQRSTAANVLEQLYDQHPVVSLILDYRELSKLRSTFVEGLLNVADNDDRIHTSFNQTLTSTGRLSSSNPNLQNIPIRSENAHLIRSMFVADSGHCLLSSDYSQIELRLLAHLSGDENLRQAFISDEDIHAETAAGIFGISQAEVTSQQRSVGKTVNFSIVYGVSAFGLSQNLKVFPKVAQSYIDGYNQHFPKVMPFLHALAEQGKERGYVETMFKRRRYIPELASRNYQQREFGKRAAMNMPIQGSAADLIKIAMVKITERIRKEKLKAKLLLQVHDELILTAPEEESEKVSKLLQEVMQHAYELTIPLKAEVKVGETWSELK